MSENATLNSAIRGPNELLKHLHVILGFLFLLLFSAYIHNCVIVFLLLWQNSFCCQDTAGKQFLIILNVILDSFGCSLNPC